MNIKTGQTLRGILKLLPSRLAEIRHRQGRLLERMNEKAYQAVANANGANQLDIIIPRHRIITLM